MLFRSVYDDVASVGKRYLRAAEVGTPYCLTIDFDSIKNKDVTIRDRDTVGEYWQDFQDNTDGDYYNDPPEVTYGQLDFFVKTANEKGWDINLSNTELEIKERHDKVVKLINNIESNFNRFISKKTSDMKNISSNNGTYQIN